MNIFNYTTLVKDIFLLLLLYPLTQLCFLMIPVPHLKYFTMFFVCCLFFTNFSIKLLIFRIKKMPQLFISSFHIYINYLNFGLLVCLFHTDILIFYVNNYLVTKWIFIKLNNSKKQNVMSVTWFSTFIGICF